MGAYETSYWQVQLIFKDKMMKEQNMRVFIDLRITKRNFWRLNLTLMKNENEKIKISNTLIKARNISWTTWMQKLYCQIDKLKK